MSFPPLKSLEAYEERMRINRAAAKNPRHFCHNPPFRAAFVRQMLGDRKVIREMKK